MSPAKVGSTPDAARFAMADQDPKTQEPVEDLEVPEREADDVKGGALNAYLSNKTKFEKQGAGS
jgi:hypothetical protein